MKSNFIKLTTSKKLLINQSLALTIIGGLLITNYSDIYASTLNISDNLIDVTTSNISKASNSSSTKISKPSQDELFQEYKRLNLEKAVTGDMKTPANLTSGSYSSGSLTEETLNNGINVLNFVRYIAGVDNNVKLDTSYNQKAQDASLIMAINGGLSHAPSQPSGLSNSIFQSGYTGASKSNLSAGQSTLRTSIINGWMNDSDSSNISKVGHRRHILRPTAKTTGFGLINNISDSKYKSYSTQYCIDENYFDKTTLNDYVKWPAENMPTEFFNPSYAWSYSAFNKSIPSNPSVTLTKNNGEEVWNITSSDKNTAGNYLNVASSSYGDDGCLIFKPSNLTYKDGDIFTVEIKSNNSIVDSYKVNFFDIEPLTEPTVTEVNERKITYIKNDTISPISVTATTNKGNLSYQWYAEDVIIEGATNSHFTPPSNIGSLNYHCRVTADYNDTSKYTDSYTTNVTILPESVTFSDIDTHWAKSSIEYITEKGWVSGSLYRGENKYNPDNPITRGDFVTALGIMENVNVNQYKESNFTDISSYTSGKPYIIWANESNIVNGMSETSFSPSTSITREQMALILFNHITSLGYSIEKTSERTVFSDDDKISSWAKEAVYEIQQMGIILGKGDNLFDPQGTSTRAEFSALIERFSKMINH